MARWSKVRIHCHRPPKFGHNLLINMEHISDLRRECFVCNILSILCVVGVKYGILDLKKNNASTSRRHTNTHNVSVYCICMQSHKTVSIVCGYSIHLLVSLKKVISPVIYLRT